MCNYREQNNEIVHDYLLVYISINSIILVVDYYIRIINNFIITNKKKSLSNSLFYV